MNHANIPALWSTTLEGVRPMTEDEAKGFISMTFGLASCEVEGAELEAHIQTLLREGASIPFGTLIMVRRLALTGQKFDPALVLFVSTLADRAAMAVIYAYGVARWQRENDRVMTLEDFAMEVSPMGVPTEERLCQVWDAQKFERGNWFDHQPAWTADEIEQVAA